MKLNNFYNRLTNRAILFSLIVSTMIFSFVSGIRAADGDLDLSFGTNGIVNEPNPSTGFETVVVQPDGKILAAGRILITTPTFSNTTQVVRYNSDGTLDTTLSTGGRLTIAVPGGTLDFPTLITQPDGKFIIVGRFSPADGSNTKVGLARFNANGILDTTFGTGGITVSNFPEGNTNSQSDAVLQPDGKIVAVSTNQPGNSVAARFLNSGSVPTVNNPTLRFADFDGDAKTDIAVFRAGTWFINPSGSLSAFAAAPNAAYGVQFGQSGDVTVPADYDGDGKTDIAVWRGAAFANFYILQSANNTVRIEQFGTTGDNPTISGDWDADGKADLAVYRGGSQSFFYYRPSAQAGVNFVPIQWGTTGDTPIFGDFDGDKKLDAAIYRVSNNTFYVRQSSTGTMLSRQWGNAATDAIFAGDFDGDGKSDFAVQRFTGTEAGTWYVAQSGGTNLAFQWGTGADVPVPADYDGDGKMDFAVFRRSNQTWYAYQSATNTARAATFGASTDFPLSLNLVR